MEKAIAVVMLLLLIALGLPMMLEFTRAKNSLRPMDAHGNVRGDWTSPYTDSPIPVWSAWLIYLFTVGSCVFYLMADFLRQYSLWKKQYKDREKT